MSRVVTQILRSVIQNGSGGAHGKQTVPQPETVQCHDFELPFEKFFRVFLRKDPVVERSPQHVAARERKTAFRFPFVMEGCTEQTFSGLETVQQ